jgi:riboflavin biosynthesis pyrimidine reductase
VRQIFPASAAAPEIGPIPGRGRRQEAGPAVTALGALYAYPDAAASASPWLRASMVASVDGAASLVGRSGGLSGDADRLVFSVLRSLADVILVGAGTARAEGYRPVRDSEVWPALRAGRAPVPPIAVVTGKLDLSEDAPLLAGTGQARTIVLTTEATPAARRAAVARRADVVVAGPDAVSPAAAVGALAARGYRRVLVEGGPGLLGQITAAGLLDEICVTVSPVLEGGHAGRIMAAPQDRPGVATGLRLAHVLEDHGFLLCRYLRADATGSADERE